MYYLFCPFHPVPHADNGGCAILPPGWIHPRRKLDSSVIILGRKGNVFLEEEGELLEVKPNRLVLLTAGRYHQGLKPIDSQASYYWFHFTLPNEPILFSDNEIAPILSNEHVAFQRLSEASLIPQQLNLGESDHIAQLFRELLNEQERPYYTKWRLQLLFLNLLIELTKETFNTYQPPERTSTSSSLVYEIVSEINTHITDPNLSVKSIADNLEHNPDYIGRQFKNVMGMAIGGYILQQRMKLAERLLKETRYSIREVVLQCGFVSFRHFLRQFKREYGMTPSELRRRHLAIHMNIQ